MKGRRTILTASHARAAFKADAKRWTGAQAGIVFISDGKGLLLMKHAAPVGEGDER